MATPKLTEALIAARRNFAPAVKSRRNPHTNSMYVGLAEVIDATEEALATAGLVVVQTTESDDSKIYVVTRLMHTSGEEIEGRYLLSPAKADPQGFGSAMTYARRYCLMAILGIAPEDDDDGNAASQPKARQSAPAARQALPPPQATNGQATAKPSPVANLAALARSKGVDAERLLEGARKAFPAIASLDQLSSQQCQTLAKRLETHPTVA